MSATIMKNRQGWHGKSLSRLGWPIVIVRLVIVSLLSPAPALPQEQDLPVIDYRIGPNDLLDIKVFELPEISQIVRVAEDGTITLPMLEKIDVANLTAQQLEQKLAVLLEEKWLQTAHVTVFIREFQKVAVLGAIAQPGMYEVSGKTTLLNMIARAGGLTSEASNELYLYRTESSGDRIRIVVNLRELTQEGNQNLNVPLQPKDEIIIPVDKIITFYVYGEVNNPGMLTARTSANMTILKAIAQAGGPTEWASKSRVIVNRHDSKTGKEAKFRVDLKAIIKGKQLDFKLEDGDIVIVP